MKKKTNIEAVKLYIARDGAECLFCGGTNLQGNRYDYENGSAIRQEMTCLDYKEEWTDSYHLSSVIQNGEVYDKPEADLKKLFRHFTSRNFVDVKDMMDELARFIGIKPSDDASKAACDKRCEKDPDAKDEYDCTFCPGKAEKAELTEVAVLEDLWKELRTRDEAKATDVMGHLTEIINRKRGTNNICGCGGELQYYDGALGYDAFVCQKCEQHYPSI